MIASDLIFFSGVSMTTWTEATISKEHGGCFSELAGQLCVKTQNSKGPEARTTFQAHLTLKSAQPRLRRISLVDSFSHSLGEELKL